MQFLDLKKQYESIKDEIEVSIKRVLDDGVFIGGKEVLEFEKELKEFLGVKNAITLNSGTDALFLSLKALEIGAGDEIITTTFTFIATAEIILNLGAKPVFADIKDDTFNIDPEEIEKRITPKTKAIIPVHLFGKPAEMERILEIAKKHKLYVIEDAAQAIGAKYKGNSAGTMGDTGAFSFFPSKNLGAFGDGGLVTTNNSDLADKIMLLKNHGSSSDSKYFNLVSGINSRLDSIQAAILRVKLKHLNDWNRKRLENSRYYNFQLKEVKEIILPDAFDGDVFNQYTIKAKNRDTLKKYLESKEIATAVYYPLPLHLQPAFKELGYKQGDFPLSEKAGREVLSLPIYPEISKKDQDLIIEAIKSFYQNGKK